MKKIVLVLVVFCSMSIMAQTQVKIDTIKSIIKWKGSALFNFNQHFGTVKFKNGQIIKENDSIMGGHFEIDMNSIINTEGNFSEDLIDHLKSSDFFDTQTFPVSRLEIIHIKYIDSSHLDMKARLTIKNISQTIAYRATIESMADHIIMKSKFIIDRTRWKINYESKGFSENVKDAIISDAIISDAIEFEVIVIARLKPSEYIKTATGLQYKILKKGTGIQTTLGDEVLWQNRI